VYNHDSWRLPMEFNYSCSLEDYTAACMGF
jgi:hypothetical protein